MLLRIIVVNKLCLGGLGVEESSTILVPFTFMVRDSLGSDLFFFKFFLLFSGVPRDPGFESWSEWVSYGALRRSWDLPFRLELKKLSMLNFYGLAEVGGTLS